MTGEALPLDELIALAQRVLLLSLLVSLPVLLVAAAVGLLTAVFQAATQVHDSALAHFPKFVAVVLALIVSGPWIGRQVLSFTLLALGQR